MQTLMNFIHGIWDFSRRRPVFFVALYILTTFFIIIFTPNILAIHDPSYWHSGAGNDSSNLGKFIRFAFGSLYVIGIVPFSRAILKIITRIVLGD